MTRKHYKVLAQAMLEVREAIYATAYRRSEAQQQGELWGWEVSLHGIADALKLDNPRFDRERFYAAAGLR